MATDGPPGTTHAYVDVPWGQVHVAACGPAGAPTVVLLHQSPRSWAEFRDVLPRLGRTYRCIAPDMPGFGDSPPLPGETTIEALAAAVAEIAAALGVDVAHVAGHHTGGVVAVELAAAHPDLVDRLVLSSTAFTGPEFRRRRAEQPPIDAVSRTDDGSYLLELWRRRAGFYPAGRPDLLEAFVADALKGLDRVEAGHRAVGRYRMEERIHLVTAPCLVIRAAKDPYASPHAAELVAALPGARLVEIAEGMVPLPDQLPGEFAACVAAFLGERT
jgi:pimeloyl-ACP methyl ester carboxylesterase